MSAASAMMFLKVLHQSAVTVSLANGAEVPIAFDTQFAYETEQRNDAADNFCDSSIF